VTHHSQNFRLSRGFHPRVERLEERCNPDGSFGAWSAPVNLGAVINTSSSDQHPAISKDGLSLYISSDRPGGFGGLDIWVSHRAKVDSPWEAPVNLGPVINTTIDDRVPTFSRDGHWMFFGSINRPGGFGATDIWASYRQDVHGDFAWETPVNLGANVNTSTDEDGATFFQDDETGINTLYFTSLNRAGYPGTDWDIYASVQNLDGTFGPAVPVTPLNLPGGPTDARDTRTAIRKDGREMFITTNRSGGQGLIDLWVSTRATTSDQWSTPVNLGPTVNSSANDGAPAISSDGQTLYFYSNRSGGSGGNDLYMTSREKIPGGSPDGGTQAAVLLKGGRVEDGRKTAKLVLSTEFFIAPGSTVVPAGQLTFVATESEVGASARVVELPPDLQQTTVATVLLDTGLVLHADEVVPNNSFAEGWLLGLPGAN